jgi:hypothetical protein
MKRPLQAALPQLPVPTAIPGKAPAPPKSSPIALNRASFFVETTIQDKKVGALACQGICREKPSATRRSNVSPLASSIFVLRFGEKLQSIFLPKNAG